MTGMIRRLIAQGTVGISTYGTDGQWGEIDNAEDVALYQAMLAEKALTLEPVPPAETGAA
jgi:hypothetical protein